MRVKEHTELSHGEREKSTEQFPLSREENECERKLREKRMRRTVPSPTGRGLG
jgi:hypothetical protein